MIRSILKIGVLLVIGIVGYNYFLGTPEEKEKAKNTISKVKEAGKVVGGVLLDLGKDGVALLKEEREKFREGKYDKAVDKVGGLISQIKEKVEGSGGALLEQVKDLEKQKDAIAEQLEKAKNSVEGLSGEAKENLNRDFEKLTNEAEDVLKKMDGGE